MLNKDHTPKIDVLFKLADLFDTARVALLILTGHLKTGDQALHERQARVSGADPLELALELELLQRFRRLPDEWKEIAIEQVALLVRLAEVSPRPITGQGDQ